MASEFWNDYRKWNELISDRYLKPESAHRPVYLDVDDTDLADTLMEQGWGNDDDQADFIGVVRKTLLMSLELYDDPLEIHMLRAKPWLESQNDEPPPFLALLAFFSYAAYKMTTTEDAAAHNYYAPLTELIFGEGWIEEERDAVQAGYVKSAATLWRGYAHWLEYTMHGFYGNPTTESLDRRVNIKYPLSQAILRTHDREILQDCFAYNLLRPGERLSGPDMEKVLSQWLPGSPLSSITKSIWKKGTQHRSAIAQIAIEELIAWDGMLADPTSDGSRTGNLILLVNTSPQPFPRFNCSVGIRGSGWAQTEIFDVIEGSSKPYLASSGATIEGLTLKRSESSLWEVMEDLSLPDLFGSLIRMENKDTGDSVRWVPREILVLEEDDELRKWVDTRSTTIDKAMKILAHHSVEDKLCNFLAPYLGRSLIRWDSNNMRGIPEGWTLFEDVWIKSAIQTEDKEFITLNSKTMSSRVDFIGGLKIPSERIWLKSKLPTISLAAHHGFGDTPDDREKAGIFKLKLEEVSYLPDPTSLTLEPEEGSQTVQFNLTGIDLPSGQYRMTIEHQPNGGSSKPLAVANCGV